MLNCLIENWHLISLVLVRNLNLETRYMAGIYWIMVLIKSGTCQKSQPSNQLYGWHLLNAGIYLVWYLSEISTSTPAIWLAFMECWHWLSLALVTPLSGPHLIVNLDTSFMANIYWIKNDSYQVLGSCTRQKHHSQPWYQHYRYDIYWRSNGIY